MFVKILIYWFFINIRVLSKCQCYTFQPLSGFTSWSLRTMSPSLKEDRTSPVIGFTVFVTDWPDLCTYLPRSGYGRSRDGGTVVVMTTFVWVPTVFGVWGEGTVRQWWWWRLWDYLRSWVHGRSRCGVSCSHVGRYDDDNHHQRLLVSRVMVVSYFVKPTVVGRLTTLVTRPLWSRRCHVI